MKSLLFLEQVLSLMRMPRAHVRSLGNTFDTIASHSFFVSILAYIIARDEGFDEATAQRAMMMGLFHDLEEARTGDHDFIAKHYVEVEQEKAIKDQFKQLTYGEELEEMMMEYEKRESDSAKCAKDADHIAQMMTEWNLMWMGNKLAERWYKSSRKNRIPVLNTKAAKDLAKDIEEGGPNDWWIEEFKSKSFQKDKLLK